MNNLCEGGQAVGGAGRVAGMTVVCQMSARAHFPPLLLLNQVCSTSPAWKLNFLGFCFPGHPRTYLQSVPSKLIPQQVKREAVSVLPEQEPDDLAWGYRGLVS
uniref:Uncharacterized protein n=1 Tax=Peromyscus maniculatus bairdii TaxID=230844 RepID=A0A8C8UBE4_PERMB